MISKKKLIIGSKSQNKIPGNMILYGWIILIVTTISQTTISFISLGIGALAPFLATGLELSKTQLGLAGGAVNVGMTFTLILAGRAVDQWGEKLVLVFGGLLTGISILLASRSNSFEGLLFLLYFTGLWAASATPAGAKAVMTWFPYSQRGLAISIRQTGVPIGGLIAAGLLPLIAQSYGWQVTMIGMGLIPILGAVLSQVMYKEYPETSGAETNINKNANRGSFKDIIENKYIWLVSFTAMTYVASQFCIIIYLVLYLHDDVGYSIVFGSIFLALAQAGGIVGRIFWGTASDRFFAGSRKPALASVGLLTVLMCIAVAFLNNHTPMWVVGIVSCLLGFSAIGWNGVWVTFVSELVGRDKSGTALGLALTMVQIGIFIFPPIFGIIVDHSGSYRYGWGALAGLVLLGVSLLSIVHEHKQAENIGKVERA